MRATVRHLGKGVAIYGAGDAAVQALNLLLLPVYVKFEYLVAADYGTIGLIIAIEMIAKVVSRWGLDGAFMRFYHDREAGNTLPLLCSTLVWFTLAANTLIFGGAQAASAWLGPLFPNPEHLLAYRLMLANTFLISLTYVPFHLMRLRDQAVAFSAIGVARSAGTLLLRLVFVMGFGWGAAGWFAADVVVTVLVWPVLWKWLAPMLALRFSAAELGEALRFGLPRLPHGLAQQGLDAGNKLLLNMYIPRHQLGVYTNGFTLGTAIRFFTSAFETAWAPFYYGAARKPNGPVVFAKVTTYGVAILTMLVAVTTAVAGDVVLVMLTPEYLQATQVIPVIAVGMAVQGVYLLTSIGLNLTSKTYYYPVATFSALAVGLGGGLVLMPRFGVTGAAVAFLASTLTQTAVAFTFAQRQYPIPYESARLVRVVLAGIGGTLAAVWLVPPIAPLAGLALRPAVVVGVFVSVLAATGFFRRSERAVLLELWSGLRQRGGTTGTGGAEIQ